MSKWQGDKISVEIYGASHGENIGVKCQGFPSIQIDNDRLLEFLERRKPSSSAFSTARKEADLPRFISGVEDGKILEDNFEAVIYNTNQKSADYNELLGKPRPSHADYGAYLIDGTVDFSGGGRFSGRLTAPFTIAGAIAKQYLKDNFNVDIKAYLSSVGKVQGKSYKTSQIELTDFDQNYKEFPALSNSKQMLDEITNAKTQGDSVGAVVECVVYNPVKGIGDNLFSGVDGKIASLIYGIPAVKGVEFGLGFELSQMQASVVNDGLYFDEKGEVKTYTNNSGGINGGITNGMPITLSVAFKPTPSIIKSQKTVDLINKQNVEIQIKGRHDCCVAVRAVPVVESAVAIALLDMILQKKERN